MMLSVLLLFVYFAIGEQKTTLKARITKSGFNFFDEIAYQIADYEIENLIFPTISLPIDGGPGKGQIDISDLNLLYFDSPQLRMKMVPPDKIAWRANGGSMIIIGSWTASYTFLIPIYLSGSMFASAKDVDSIIQTRIFAKNNRPQVDISFCYININNINFILNDGVINYIINLFGKQISEAVLNAIREKLCLTLQTKIINNVNENLLMLPTSYEIIDNITVHYKLEKDPIVTRDYVDVEAYADITYGNSTCDLYARDIDKGVGSDNHMAHFWISETIPNCLLKSIYDNDLSLICDKNFSGGKYANFLRTSCNFVDFCIGTFFEKLRENYPNKYVDIRFSNQIVPKVQITKEGMSLNGIFNVDLYISPWSKMSERLARLESEFKFLLFLEIVESSIVFKLKDVSVSIKEKESIIGTFSPEFLDKLKIIFTWFLYTAIEGLGIPLPVIDNVTFADNTVFTNEDSHLRIDTDLIFLKN